jgi:hypothetical protein
MQPAVVRREFDGYGPITNEDLMTPLTIARTALLAVLLATFAVGSDKTAPTYQKGTIKGWDKRTDIWGFLDRNGEPIPRNTTTSN